MSGERRTSEARRSRKKTAMPKGLLVFGLLLFLPASQAGPGAPARPVIEPDYTDVVIPPNIAPLNFQIKGAAPAYRVTIRSQAGEPITISSRDGRVRIPPRAWRALISQNAGGAWTVAVEAREPGGAWLSFLPITNHIASDPVDGYLVYRQLRPLYNLYTDLGIYQRNVAGFEQTEVLENRRFERGCLNCHTFLHHSPSNMFFHVRGVPGNPIIMAQHAKVRQIPRTAGYSSWHPSGRLLAYSVNKLSLFYHTRGETRDVFDAASDLNLYRLDSNVVVVPPALALSNRLETWPSWSPDGRYLYYCSAEQLPQERFREVRYDLMRMAYDIEKDRWGEPETLLAARDIQASAAQPRVSPDGRWLVFVLSKYGNFPIYQPSADLFLADLVSWEIRRLEINSDQTEAWHCWSSNGRWMVFSSKRRDGLFTHPYFAHVDGQGRFSKPFVLPQEDPAFYDTFIKNFNVPELIKEPIPVTPAEFARAVLGSGPKRAQIRDASHPSQRE